MSASRRIIPVLLCLMAATSVLADDTGFRVLRENADTRFGPSHEESR